MRRALLLLVLALMALSAAPGAAAAAPDPRGLRPLGIGHVFVINVENKSFNEAYVTNKNPYLSKTLRSQGVLLRQYFGTGHLSLDNYIAQLSGQAPNAATQSDCQIYLDQQPGVPGPAGQSVGHGCVYPARVKTLPDQLTAARLTWRGYMEDMGNDLSREPDRCGEPTNPTGAGMRDGTQSATATDQYAARHNPFVYFHSILDSPRCHQQVLPLTALSNDLARSSTTANFTYITPNLCNDGHDDPCVGKNVRGTKAGGLTAVDFWLQKYVPLITSSPAFKQDGVLVIAADESENNDTSACCNEPPGLNTPLPGITGPGGGRIGALVLGRCVKPGSSSDVPYNHYSLLRSFEDLFGIRQGGSDGAGHLGYAGAAGLVPFGRDVFASSCGAAAAAPASVRERPAAPPSRTGGGPPPAAGGPPPESGGPLPASGGPLPATSGALAATGGLPLGLTAAALTGTALLVRRRLRKAS